MRSVRETDSRDELDETHGGDRTRKRTAGTECLLSPSKGAMARRTPQGRAVPPKMLAHFGSPARRLRRSRTALLDPAIPP